MLQKYEGSVNFFEYYLNGENFEVVINSLSPQTLFFSHYPTAQRLFVCGTWAGLVSGLLQKYLSSFPVISGFLFISSLLLLHEIIDFKIAVYVLLLCLVLIHGKSGFSLHPYVLMTTNDSLTASVWAWEKYVEIMQSYLFKVITTALSLPRVWPVDLSAEVFV